MNCWIRRRGCPESEKSNQTHKGGSGWAMRSSRMDISGVGSGQHRSACGHRLLLSCVTHPAGIWCRSLQHGRRSLRSANCLVRALDSASADCFEVMHLSCWTQGQQCEDICASYGLHSQGVWVACSTLKPLKSCCVPEWAETMSAVGFHCDGWRFIVIMVIAGS